MSLPPHALVTPPPDVERYGVIASPEELLKIFSFTAPTAGHPEDLRFARRGYAVYVCGHVHPSEACALVDSDDVVGFQCWALFTRRPIAHSDQLERWWVAPVDRAVPGAFPITVAFPRWGAAGEAGPGEQFQIEAP